MKFFVRGMLLLLGLFVLSLAISSYFPVYGSGFVVNDSADTNDGTCNASPGNCTLREAINAANANAGADTITFNIPNMAGCTSANVCTITLGSTLPAIDDDLTIDGSVNAADITVSGAGAYRVLLVNSSKTLNLDALTIANGKFDVTGGGGIRNNGTLNVTGVTFSGNTTTGSGGAIYNGDTANVTDSTFSNNSGANDAGGIYNALGGTLNVTGSTFVGNTTNFGGGGIGSNGSILNVANSTFFDNTAQRAGGGIHSGSGTTTVTNSTLSGNKWGGVSFGGGGISSLSGGTTTILRNTIVANSTGGDCFAGLSSAVSADAFNIDSDGSCDSATTKTNAEINLAALANNGGPTQTMKLQSPSDALNTGNNSVCGAAAGAPNYGAGGVDQRGVIRPQNTTCEVGAYELLFCLAGTFDNGSATCASAPAGYYVPLAGATSATACDPGYFQPNTGASLCSQATAGYYVPTFASIEQTECPPGTTSGLAASFCTQTGASGFVVNDATDTDDGTCAVSPGDCTLREAINAANTNAGADTITFDIPYNGCNVSGQGVAQPSCEAGQAGDETTTADAGQAPAIAIPSASSCSGANVCTIELTSALPTIDETLTIDGSANSANITVSGANLYPVLFANGGAPLTVISLAITDGYTAFHGAGIYAGDALTMTNVLVKNSVSEQTAGGVAAEGPVVMTGSTLAGNTTNNGGGGGGVFLSTANISNSTFRKNKTDSASNAGGAYFTGAAVLNNVTFENNLAGLAGGGGAVFEGSANLTGGAFKNNIASFAGGGAYFNATATIQATTFYSNSVLANRGGGAYFNGAATVQNALFNGNSAQADRGGGAYFRQDAQITATDFVTNTASNRAGGAYLNATGTLTNTDFYSNTATVRGGGLYLGGAAAVKGGVIQGNECESACLGGGVFVASTLVLTDTEFIDNKTDGDGGGANTNANTTMTGPTFQGNQSTGYGTGGGLSHNGGTLNLSGGAFTNNIAGSYGGGINANGVGVNVDTTTFTSNEAGGAGDGGGAGIAVGGAAQLTVTNSTFDRNQTTGGVEGGAGIFNFGIATITNSTFNGNQTNAQYGGGAINNFGTLTLRNSTLAGNSAANNKGGGLAHADFNSSDPQSTLYNNLIANNTGGDCYKPVGTLTADAFNIDSDGSCDSATQKTAAQIALGALANNGGPTQTMALQTGSQAIDFAPSASCTAAPVNGLDQRGQPRNLDGNGVASSNECDAGAYESPAAAPVVPRIIVHKQTRPNGDTTEFQFKLRGPVGRDFSLADDEPHSTGQIPVGIYTLQEILPPGWDPAIPLAAMTCDDGSPLSAIDLASDEVLVCRFLNYKRGNIVVKKVTLPPVAAPSFAMRLIDNTSLAKTQFSLANGGQFDTGAITSVPTYKLLEPAATLPGGWKKKSIACSNGSPATAIVVPPGGTVTCTVTNENSVPTNILLSNNSVDENKAVGTVVGALSAVDSVAGDTHTFSFVNDGSSAASGNSRFQITGNQLKTAQIFDYETKTSHNIKLKVTDTAGQSKVKNFVIQIVNKPG